MRLLSALLVVDALLTPVTQASAGDDGDDVGEVMSIPDAGRRMRLGDLFDARTDTVVSGTLWSERLMRWNRRSTRAAFTEVAVSTSDTVRQKLELMGISIDAALDLKIGAGSLKVKSSFKFLDHERSTGQSIQMTSAFRTRTYTERLNAFADEMLGNMNGYVLGAEPCPTDERKSCQKATHVVTEVTWGADVYASFESLFEDSYDHDLTKVFLNVKLKQPTMSLDSTLDFTDLREVASRSNQTRVSIYGDFRLHREMPTSVEDAIEFMRSLPNQTDTLFGDGVPMEVVLTPLSWFDSTAAKMKRRINADTVQRFLGIYESLDESAASVRDLVNLGYGGFRAWKVSQDAYYNDFRTFRSKFSNELFEAMSDFKSGFLNQGALEGLELKYLNSPFEATRMASEVEKRRDTIVNLMALVSEFKDAHITFAEHLSVFFAPTFDAQYDRVYGLILTGFNPNSDRSGIANVREFITLARSRVRSDGDLTGAVKHCVERSAFDDPSRIVCAEKLAFVAIHATSFCEDFCGPEFCQLDPVGNATCPTRSSEDMPPQCWLDEKETERLRCHASRHAGECSPNSTEHHIHNNERPFSDCWCACPRTQVIEYHESQPAVRLTDNMPRVPRRPSIREVTGHDVAETLPLKQTAMLHLNLDDGDGVRNFRVTLLWSEAVQGGAASYTSFRQHQSVEDTTHRVPVIALRNLVAGRQYQLEVQGLNSQGAGRPAQLEKPFLVAHRMATVSFLPAGKRPANPPHNHGPAWLQAQIVVQLSEVGFQTIGAVTLHITSVHSDSIATLLQEESDEAVAVCSDVDSESVTASRVACYLPLDSEFSHAGGSRDYQLRVWDVSGLLTAFSNVTLLAPSGDTCKQWGSKNLYCPGDASCVSSCSSCGPGRTRVNSECRQVSCSEGKIWCPVTQECLNRTAAPEDVCREDCKDSPGTTGMGAELGILPHGEEACISRCNVRLPEGLTSQLVARGDSVMIQCESPWFAAQRKNVTFTCPSIAQMGRDDLNFVYDEQAVLKHITGGLPLPLCNRCPADQFYDEAEGLCRFPRGPAAQWNYVTGGDFEEPLTPDGALKQPFESIAALDFALATPGAGGSNRSLRLRRLAAEAVGFRQYLPQNPLAVGLALDVQREASRPAVGSIWRGSVYYVAEQVGTSPAQLCLRDRSDAEPQSCAEMATASLSDEWHFAEVRLEVGEGATLLAVEVHAGGVGAKLLVDRLAVERVDGSASSQASISVWDTLRSGWGIMKGMISYFRGACPAGWVPNPEAAGRVVKGLGEADAAHAGTVQGEPLGHLQRRIIEQVPQHIHSMPTLETSESAHSHTYADNSGWSHCGTTTRIDCGGSHESGFRSDITRDTSVSHHRHTVPASQTGPTGDSEGVDVTMAYVEYVSCIFVGM